MDEPLFKALFEETQAPEPEPRPRTVTELNDEVKALVDRRFDRVWVEGEVVDFKDYRNGNWYFNLHEGQASIKCVRWAGNGRRITFTPKDGLTVRIRGKLDYWTKKGELKLNVETLEPSGEGALRAAFDQIRDRLNAEGLFAAELKRPMPFFPRRVGVVTSRSGAAFHDILTVLERRAKGLSVVLAPATVQGESAAASIRNALLALNDYNSGLESSRRLDVLIVGRGGGSAEDLWAFNDEALARAIRASAIPVISAVGHEIDWTICDLVADERAATPSAAAEMVAAREEDICAAFTAYAERLGTMMNHRMRDLNFGLESLGSRLDLSFMTLMQSLRMRYNDASARLSPMMVRQRLSTADNRLENARSRSQNAVNALVRQRQERLALAAARLDTLSPLAVLGRGYSITQSSDGRVITDAGEVIKGDRISVRLGRGKLDAEVLSSE